MVIDGKASIPGTREEKQEEYQRQRFRLKTIALLICGSVQTAQRVRCYFGQQAPSAHVLPQTALGAGGVGGTTAIALLNASLVFTTTNGRQYGFRGPIQALTTPTSPDLSVLGRDVIDRFHLAYARADGVLALLTPPDTITL